MTVNPTALPDECCGRCERAVMKGGELVCYGMPPTILVEDGKYTAYRGAGVADNEPPCFAFKRRLQG